MSPEIIIVLLLRSLLLSIIFRSVLNSSIDPLGGLYIDKKKQCYFGPSY